MNSEPIHDAAAATDPPRSQHMSPVRAAHPTAEVDYCADVPVTGGPASDELMHRFWAYEAALMNDDLDAMSDLFSSDPGTMRADGAGTVVGPEQIAAYRNVRGGAPPRTVVEVQRRHLAEGVVLLHAITRPESGGTGQQTQVWRQEAGTWRVLVAHVATPAPAFDSRVWRVVGDPLEPADDRDRSNRAGPEAPLAGCSVAVKDLFSVRGHRIGAGSPAWLEQATPQTHNARAVEALLQAGATIRGIARTDEFAYSLAGTNAHYGTPPNPSAPTRISGGSSSGSASAVAQGQSHIGLGTDTGGSIRVPSAYQGLWGIRTTHGLISRDGLLPLAPSFDTVGWMSATADLLVATTSAMVDAAMDPHYSGPQAAAADGPLVLLEALTNLAEADVADAVRVAAAGLGARCEDGPSPHEAQAWRETFQTVQGAEAWATHGWWVSRHWDRMAPDVAARFAKARGLDPHIVCEARDHAQTLAVQLRELVGRRVVAVPSASCVAPEIALAHAGGTAVESARDATMALTSLAGLAGLPAVSVPLRTHSNLPCGLCLIGPAGSDLSLVRRARALTDDL